MNDPAQFETFVLNYQDMVFSTAVRLLGNEAEAEDVAQEAFLRAWNHWHELAPSPGAGGWTPRPIPRRFERQNASWYRLWDHTHGRRGGRTGPLSGSCF